VKGGIMQKRFLSLVFVLLLSYADDLSWVWQNPYPQGNKIIDVCAINENIVFAVDREAGTILKSTDGGLTWKITGIPNPNNQWGYSALMAIDFPDPMTGYAVGEQILKTTDQGITWFRLTPSNVSGGTCVDFIQGNNQIGYIAGIGWIAKTTDGGQTWNLQDPGTNKYITTIHFPVNADTGYAGGGYGASSYPLLLRTTNGGSEWITIPSPVDSIHYESVYFVNNRIGYACGYNLPYGLAGRIIKTTNAGVSWSVIYSSSSRELYSVYFLDSQTGYAGGWDGTSGRSFIMKTTNGGASWNTVLLPKKMNYNLPLSIVNYQIGYAGGWVYVANGGPGQLLKTTDGGTTWNFLNKGTEVNFYAIDFPETDQIGYAVGDSGYILKTTDSGTNWVRQFTGTGLSFYDVDFINNQFGFAVGARGVCFKTTNGGATWIPKNSNTTENLYAVKVIDAQVAYIGGGTGAIGGG